MPALMHAKKSTDRAAGKQRRPARQHVDQRGGLVDREWNTIAHKSGVRAQRACQIWRAACSRRDTLALQIKLSELILALEGGAQRASGGGEEVGTAYWRILRKTSRCVSTPARPTNTALWTRESPAQHEVEKLIEVTKRNRPGRRRYAHDLPILVYRHELRAAGCAGSTSTSKRRRCTASRSFAREFRTLRCG
jgi:hypothetical protein